MLICCCSLAGTKACLTCPQYLNQAWTAPPFSNTVKGRRVTKKYDDKGNLIEEIIEE
jgi:hypothetical protein